MKFLEEFKNIVICMGGFYIVLNYFFFFGKKYVNFGLEDFLIEFGVYVVGIILVFMFGKLYNCGI